MMIFIYPTFRVIIENVHPEYFLRAFLLALALSIGAICTQKGKKVENRKIAQRPREDITPLINFDWKAEQPLQLRPYKPKFFLTMGIERMDTSDLLQIDWDHFNRLELRKSILDSTEQRAIFINPSADLAAFEMYEWLTQEYLHRRFPTIFKVNQGTENLRNMINGDEFSLKAPSRSADALHIIGRMIDEDMMFLLPSEDGDGYSLQAYLICFESGFSSDKMPGSKLRDLHREVPGYKAKLQMPMERFIEKLKPGRYVQRSNWTIVMSDKLRIARGANHSYDESNEQIPVGKDMSNAQLRCERQVLHRLPQSGALVFIVKTYLYSLKDIKAEGSGQALADAIDGLHNVEGMPRYRGSLSWGAAAQHYLRS